jgi:hypothetical protein
MLRTFERGPASSAAAAAASAAAAIRHKKLNHDAIAMARFFSGLLDITSISSGPNARPCSNGIIGTGSSPRTRTKTLGSQDVLTIHRELSRWEITP